MKKRILSMLLCVMMVVTAIPLALVPTVAADGDAAEAAAPTITYDDLYVPGATYQWDAFDLTAEDGAIDAFTNTTDSGLALALAGTAGDKYVRSTSELLLTNLLPTYEDENGNIINENFTFEIVAKQIWDAEFEASARKATENADAIYPYVGRHYTTASGSLIRRYADTRFQFTTQLPTQDATTGEWTRGYIASAGIARINPSTGKIGNVSAASSWLTANIDEIFSFGATFSFDPTNEIPQYRTQLTRDSAVLAEYDAKYVLSTTKQNLNISDETNRLCFGYYAIRSYNRVLEVAELQQNHFADLAKYFAISDKALAAYEGLVDASKAAVIESFVGVTFDETSKEAVEQVIIDAYNAQAAAMIEALYVKDANFKWDAFDMKATDDVITAFENQVGETDVSLPVAVTMGDKYILWPQTTSKFNLTSFVPVETYDIGGTTYYKAGDYSLEMTVHQYWQEGFATSGISNMRVEPFGETSNYTGQQQRLFFTFNSTVTEDSGFLSAVKFSPMNASTYAQQSGRTTISKAFLNGLNKPYTIGVNWDFSFDTMETVAVNGTFNINATRDGASLAGMTYGSKLQTNRSGTFTGNKLYFGTATPFAFYSIRVYPFALTAEQSAQNHFAELCDYFNASFAALKVVDALDSNDKATLFSLFKGKTFADYENAAALDAAIIAAVEEVEHLNYKAALRELYVEGATYMWDAFDLTAEDGAVDAFTNQKDTGLTLALAGTAGDKYVRSTSALLLTNLMTTTTNDAGQIINDDFTFEIVAKQIYDEEFAAVMATGQKYTEKGGFLLHRWADTRFEIQEQVPTQNEDGTWANGFIKSAQLVKLAPTTGSISSMGNAVDDNWLTNPIDDAYSFGATMKFDATNEYPQFHVEYIRDTAVLASADTKYTLSTTKQKLGVTDAANIICMGYYAIRSYDRVLTMAELQQNHFADLANYFEISTEMIDLISAVDEAKKPALYAAFAGVNFNDTDADTFAADITKTLAAIDAAIVVGEANKGEFIDFLGYQVRTNGYAGIRSRYKVALDAQIEGIELVEVGAIMAIATEGRTTADLVVNKTADGWAATGKQMMSAAVSAEKDIFTDDEGNTCFAYTLTFEDEASQTKTYYETEILFRGYVVLLIDGIEFVYYADMTSEVFDDSISMLEASQHEAFAGYTTSQAVIAACAQSNQGGN